MSAASGNEIDDVLAIYTGAISYALQTIVEQGISLLEKLLESQGRVLSAAYACSRLSQVWGSDRGAKATSAATTPMPMAIAEIGRSLVVVVKSPSTSHEVLRVLLAGPLCGCCAAVFVTS
jgi:hypothetical protein